MTKSITNLLALGTAIKQTPINDKAIEKSKEEMARLADLKCVECKWQLHKSLGFAFERTQNKLTTR